MLGVLPRSDQLDVLQGAQGLPDTGVWFSVVGHMGGHTDSHQG